jgi:hypothetical protein
MVRVALAGVVVVAGGGAAVLALRTTSGSRGGDPGGRLLDALRPVMSAVPAGTVEVSTGAHDSAYSPKCPDNRGGRSGWSPVVVWTAFRSSKPSSAVITEVDGHLAAQGWRPTPSMWDRNAGQLQPAAEWGRTVTPGQTATAVIYQFPEGSGSATGSWYLGAQAKPPGFALPGC